MTRPTLPISHWLVHAASTYPDRTAFVDDNGRCRTFKEYEERVARVASALFELGVKRGDRVAILETNSPEYMEVVQACFRLGAAFVPLNFRLRTSEVGTFLRASEPAVMFLGARYASSAGEYGAAVPGMSIVTWGERIEGTLSYEDLVAAGRFEQLETLDDEEILSIAFTSGTTGNPKGVMQSQRFIKGVVHSWQLAGNLTTRGIYHGAAPMFHMAGWPVQLWWGLHGFGSLVASQFDASATARWLSSGEVKGALLVPTMISAVLQVPGVDTLDFSELEVILYGGSPMTPAVLETAIAVFGCDFVNVFGGTEAGMQLALSRADHRRARTSDPRLLGSLGRPLPNVRVRLCDDDWNDVAPGEVGEIVAQSDSVMSGYLGDPERTAESMRDGWFRAGDLATQDVDGYLYFAGRKNDMIIRGGENIYPQEIEFVLLEHPSISSAIVVGAPDPHWGEVVHAYVTLSSGDGVSSEDLRLHCNRGLASYKVPESFHVVPEFPVNASGKIQRTELRSRCREHR